VLLVVTHHPSDLQTTADRRPMPDFYYTADDIAALLEPGDWRSSWRLLARVARSTQTAGRSPSLSTDLLEVAHGLPFPQDRADVCRHVTSALSLTFLAR
jgi:hypothetical protein